jgi:hypothetical protein
MSRIVIVGLLASLAFGCATSGKDNRPVTDGEYIEAPRFLREEIENRVAALPYQTEEQLYSNLIRLAYIGEPAIPYLLEGLEAEPARTRSSCAYVLGLVKDRRTIPALREAVDDPVPEVRYEVATSLCMLGVREGYPVLIEGLSDAEIRNRYKCGEALKLLTGQDFGYRHDDAPTDRAQAIATWERWWERLREQP